MQERLQMTREIARIKELDQKAAEDKVHRAAVMAGEVEKINSAQVERKRAVAEREILEDAMIAEYVRQRDLREQVGARTSLLAIIGLFFGIHDGGFLKFGRVIAWTWWIFSCQQSSHVV